MDGLSAEAKLQGYRLEGADDHVLELWFKNRRVAIFSQTGVTVEALNHEVSRDIQENTN